MTLLKRTLLCVFGVMQCIYAVRGSKNTLFSTYCTLLLLVNFYKAHRSEKLLVNFYKAHRSEK